MDLWRVCGFMPFSFKRVKSQDEICVQGVMIIDGIICSVVRKVYLLTGVVSEKDSTHF